MTLTIGIIAILIVVGFASGMLSSLVGVGGGIIIVPCLVFFLAFSQKTAQGTSLGVLALPVVIFGMLQYYKQGHVDFKIVAFIAIGFLAGSFAGAKIALKIDDAMLKKIFAVLLLVVAFKMLFLDKKKEVKSEGTATTLNETQAKEKL